MISKVETVPAPPFYCAICRKQDGAEFYIDTQVQTEWGAVFLCDTCVDVIAIVSDKYVTRKQLESEVQELTLKGMNNEKLVEKFTRADRILKNGFGLDYGSLILLNEGDQNHRRQREQISEQQNYLDELQRTVEEREALVASYDSRIAAADALIEEKLAEVDILSLPLAARLEAYYGSNGRVLTDLSGESVEDDRNVHIDNSPVSNTTEADPISF
jgi:hypothetical protein